MRTESLRVMACAPAFGTPGDVALNTKAILRRVLEAREARVKLLLLPELCVSSGSCGDMFHQEVLLLAARNAAEIIARESLGLVCVFGLPINTPAGVISAAAVALNGRVLGFDAKKRLSPDQLGIFSSDCPLSVLWQGQLLPVSPVFTMDFPDQPGAGIFVCFETDLDQITHADNSILAVLSMRPARAGQYSARVIKAPSLSKRGSAMLLANAGANESTGDQVFDGHAVISRAGKTAAQALPFSGLAAVADIPWGEKGVNPFREETGALDTQPHDPRYPYAPKDAAARAAWCRDCVEIAARGLLSRLNRVGIKRAILGISGGLDSAMALLITKRAFEIGGFDPEGIIASSLPALGSTAHTMNNARRLTEALNLGIREIDLKASVLRHFKDINHPEDLYDAAYENAQARERTQVLMDLSNMEKGMMVGTGDMSELALGFTSYNGDHMSMYGVNGGLYKSAIRLIIAQLAQDASGTPLHDVLLQILDTPVSPELLPTDGHESSQKTEKILGPYILHDFFLHHFILNHLTPGELLNKASEAFEGDYSRNEIIQWMRVFFRRFFQSQFKRSCLPDGPQVLDISLSPRGGLSMPSDMSAAVFLDAAERLSKPDKA